MYVDPPPFSSSLNHPTDRSLGRLVSLYRITLCSTCHLHPTTVDQTCAACGGRLSVVDDDHIGSLTAGRQVAAPTRHAAAGTGEHDGAEKKRPLLDRWRHKVCLADGSRRGEPCPRYRQIVNRDRNATLNIMHLYMNAAAHGITDRGTMARRRAPPRRCTPRFFFFFFFFFFF